MKLGKRTREVLQHMLDRSGEEDGELVQSVPGGWWLGNERVSGSIGWNLLRMCLVREVRGGSDDYRVYAAYPEEVRNVLTNPEYITQAERLIASHG